MKTKSNRGSRRRGAVATVAVVLIAALMVSLVVAGSDSVRRARKSVRATGDAQAKRWANQHSQAPGKISP